MRAMTPEEMRALIRRCAWATICTVGKDGAPYAIEATPFYIEDDPCFMINPRGGTWRNMQKSSHVLLKYTLAAPDLKGWIGVSCFGAGRFVSAPDEIREGWRLLGLVMGQDYSGAGEKFSRNPDRSPMFAVRVQTRTGRCSAAKTAPLPSFFYPARISASEPHHV